MLQRLKKRRDLETAEYVKSVNEQKVADLCQLLLDTLDSSEKRIVAKELHRLDKKHRAKDGIKLAKKKASNEDTNEYFKREFTEYLNVEKFRRVETT